MSLTFGTWLAELEPDWTIRLYECLDTQLSMSYAVQLRTNRFAPQDRFSSGARDLKTETF
ncbi:malate:quinone oxidoreductase [Pseudomonas sp. gcc21]|nr:malate:quinone oxidoreductase [Pseudomonas sp. gcc21]